jgi:hypothetical protein
MSIKLFADEELSYEHLYFHSFTERSDQAPAAQRQGQFNSKI